MDMIGRIRRLHSRKKKSEREIARITGLSRNTVAKWLHGQIDGPPKYRRGEQANKLTVFHDALRLALKADARRPKHERRTARALYAEIKGAGYSGGYTPNPSYEEVCSGLTGHTEVVSVMYDPSLMTYEELLRIFWQSHNPTQGMQQGNDVGTQYRSAIYTTSQAQLDAALASKQHYQQCLTQQGFGEITTEIQALSVFYYAEDYHQQYLAKNPQGYCGLGGLGVAYV